MCHVSSPGLLDNPGPGVVETSPGLHREVYRILRYGTALPITWHLRISVLSLNNFAIENFILLFYTNLYQRENKLLQKVRVRSCDWLVYPSPPITATNAVSFRSRSKIKLILRPLLMLILKSINTNFFNTTITTHTYIELPGIRRTIVSRHNAEAEVWCQQRSRVSATSIHQLCQFKRWVY